MKITATRRKRCKDAAVLTKLLDVQTDKQGSLRDLGADLWCCEGTAQHGGRHVGITELWPRGGGSEEPHPPCLPEQTLKCLPQPLPP